MNALGRDCRACAVWALWKTRNNILNRQRCRWRALEICLAKLNRYSHDTAILALWRTELLGSYPILSSTAIVGGADTWFFIIVCLCAFYEPRDTGSSSYSGNHKHRLMLFHVTWWVQRNGKKIVTCEWFAEEFIERGSFIVDWRLGLMLKRWDFRFYGGGIFFW